MVDEKSFADRARDRTLEVGSGVTIFWDSGSHHDGIEEERMQTRATAASRTYRFTIDVRAVLYAEHQDPAAPEGAASAAHRALVRELLARPDLLDRLLHSSAIDALGRAQGALAEQKWDGMSEQDLLRRAASGLEPGALEYFLEELEDGASVLFFDGYDASVHRSGVEEIGG